MDCAQSSITLMPWALAMRLIASMSQGVPYRCVGTTARVLGVIAASNAAGSSTWVVSPTSANTGRTPAVTAIDGIAK